MTVTGFWITSSLGSAAGRLDIVLPFPVGAGSLAYSALSVGYGRNLAIAAGESLAGFMAINTSIAAMQKWGNAAGTTDFTAAQLSADGEFVFSASYRTDV